MKISLVVPLLLLALSGLAQETIRSDELLRERREAVPSSENYANRRRVRLPWIQAYEYRTETERFAWNRQEHVLRISPNTPGMRRAQSRLAGHLRSERAIVETMYRNERIEAAYEDWLSLYISQEQLNHLTRLKAIRADQLALQQKRLQSMDTDYKALLSAQEQLNNVRIRRYEAELETHRLRELFGVDTTTVVAFEEMIALDEMLLRLSNDSLTAPSPLLAEYHYERELIRREVALEKAEKWQLLDFLQMRYNGPHDELLEERVQLRAGFVLPTSASRNLKLEELRLKQEALTREREVKQEKLTLRIAEQRSLVHNHIRVYRQLARTKDEELAQLQKIAQTVAQRRGTDPDLLLKVKEDTEKISLEKLARRDEIYAHYLRYLALTGRLFANPEQNLLAE
ncbi:MAG: hypothetical protein WA958_13550 [Tunicatimonas sp.]